MEQSSSPNGGPSRPVPSLQETGAAVSVRTAAEEQDNSESSPLIKVKQGGGTKPQAGRWWSRHPRNWNWKNLSATACLWLTYLFVSAAYSIIGPFFPSEVENFSSTTMSGYSGLTLSPAPSPQMLHV